MQLGNSEREVWQIHHVNIMADVSHISFKNLFITPCLQILAGWIFWKQQCHNENSCWILHFFSKKENICTVASCCWPDHNIRNHENLPIDAPRPGVQPETNHPHPLHLLLASLLAAGRCMQSVCPTWFPLPHIRTQQTASWPRKMRKKGKKKKKYIFPFPFTNWWAETKREEAQSFPKKQKP